MSPKGTHFDPFHIFNQVEITTVQSIYKITTQILVIV